MHCVCVDTGRELRFSRAAPNKERSEVWAAGRRALLELLAHELDEMVLVDGKRPVDPHDIEYVKKMREQNDG